jgi:CheY-like chemotaxis protein/HPt (histidine-containing phosphotransfer) domain-containing protein
MSNAIKFTGEGTVGIRVVSAPGDAQRVCFTVRDSGIGIPQDKQDAIFEAFTQADHTTHRSYGGTGLGLSIARRLVEGMGGVMELESVEGEGTCFRFTLPGCAISKPGPEIAAAQIAQLDLSAARVLVADDSETNLLVARAALGRFGITPDCVQDGHEAVAALDGGGYDLALMDGWMPGLDGYAATREIRTREAREGRAPVSIVALTAHVVGAQAQAWREAGMDAALSKPFTLSQLQEILMCHLPAERRQAGRAAPGSAERTDVVETGSPQAAADPADGLIDLTALEDLIDAAGGSKVIAERVVGLFASESQRRLMELREAVEARNAERLAAASHALRSISLNVGAVELARALAECETGARDAGAIITMDDAGTLAADVEVVNNALGEFLRARG